MADLDEIQRTLLEIRDLMKQEMEASAKHAAESQRNTEIALAQQAKAVRFQRIGVLIVLLMFFALYWWVTTQTDL